MSRLESDNAPLAWLEQITALVTSKIRDAHGKTTRVTRAATPVAPSAPLDPFELPFDDDYAATFYTNRPDDGRDESN